MSECTVETNNNGVDLVTDDRMVALNNWVSDLFPNTTLSTVPLTGDASFRRYFRVIANDQHFILMDAPPEKESVHPFIIIAKTFQRAGVRSPHIFSADLACGFLLLSDLGDKPLLSALNTTSVDVFYRAAMNILLQIQCCKVVSNYDLPAFDDALFWKEFEIFDTWYMKTHLNKKLSSVDENKLKSIYTMLIYSAKLQPPVFVHRDYHSRNIMLCDDHELGILDFQDAMWGPITYDLVSLLRDCYITWPEEKIEKWALYFYEELKMRNQLTNISFATFMQWFDWTGLQRHLKCLGIFSRLSYRDHKNNYLKEIPRVLNYVMKVCDKYSELDELTTILV